MKTFLAILLVLGSILSYVVLATQFGVYQRWPVPHFVLALAGILWLVSLIRDRFTWRRLAALVFALFLGGFYVYWTLFFSEYAQRDHRAKTGEVLATLPELELIDQSGSRTTLFKGGERGALLVFYRGFW